MLVFVVSWTTRMFRSGKDQRSEHLPTTRTALPLKKIDRGTLFGGGLVIGVSESFMPALRSPFGSLTISLELRFMALRPCLTTGLPVRLQSMIKRSLRPISGGLEIKQY